MIGKHVDHRLGLAARRLSFLVAALALAGLLNVSGCSNPSATTAIAVASPRETEAALALPEVGSATPATTATRRLDASLIGIPMEDMSERFDHLPTGTLS